MKETDKKALLKLGVVAMLLILGMALVEAMALNTVVTCGAAIDGGRPCTVTDPNGTDMIKVWNKTTGKKMMEIKNHKPFSPTSMQFTVPLGSNIVAFRDEEKPPEKDYWIINDTSPFAFGPYAKKPKKGDP